MSFEYRVLSAGELMQTPSFWQLPSARVKQYATRLQDALNRIGSDGWQLVESHKEPVSGAIYFIFQRETAKEDGVERSTGIQVMQLGARE
jgi:hypothetical protein